MDRRRREIERRAAQGDPEAQVELLIAKTRSGEIPWANVEFAAWLENDVAKAAVGNTGNVASKKSYRRWIRGLARNGGEVASARATVVLHYAMAFRPASIPPPVDHRRHRLNYAWYNAADYEPHMSFGLAADTALRWLESRSAEDAQTVISEAEIYHADRISRPLWYGNNLPLCYLPEVVNGQATSVVEQTMVAAVSWLSPSRTKWGQKTAWEALRQRIVDDLIPWALGREST